VTILGIRLLSLTLVGKSWLSKTTCLKYFFAPSSCHVSATPSSLVPLVTFYVIPSPCSTSSIASKDVATYELMGSTRLISSTLSLPTYVTILPFDPPCTPRLPLVQHSRKEVPSFYFFLLFFIFGCLSLNGLLDCKVIVATCYYGRLGIHWTNKWRATMALLS